jgi:hypothetical protein
VDGLNFFVGVSDGIEDSLDLSQPKDHPKFFEIVKKVQ